MSAAGSTVAVALGDGVGVNGCSVGEGVMVDLRVAVAGACVRMGEAVGGRRRRRRRNALTGYGKQKSAQDEHLLEYAHVDV